MKNKRENAGKTEELPAELCIPVSAGQLSELFGRTTEWVRELKTRSVIQNTGTRSRPRYDLATSLTAILDDLCRRAATADKRAARAIDARTREIELRISHAERDLIPTADCVDIVSECVKMFRDEFQCLPARFSADVSKQAAVRVEVDRSLRNFEAMAKQTIQRLRHGA